MAELPSLDYDAPSIELAFSERKYLIPSFPNTPYMALILSRPPGVFRAPEYREPNSIKANP